MCVYINASEIEVNYWFFTIGYTFAHVDYNYWVILELLGFHCMNQIFSAFLYSNDLNVQVLYSTFMHISKSVDEILFYRIL